MTRFAALACAAVLLASCGGGGGSAPAAPAAQTTRTQSGSIGLTFATTSTASTARNPLFVSPNATSAVVSINSGTAATFDVSATSTLCMTTAGVRTCTIPLSAPAGQVSISVTLMGALNGNPVTLGQGSNSVTVVIGTPFTLLVGINPSVAGVNSGMATFPSGSSFSFATPGSGAGSITFADGSGANITGSGNVPNFLGGGVTMTSSDPHVGIVPAILTTPGQPFTINYDGSALVAQAVTITAKSSTNVAVASSTYFFSGLVATRYDLGAPNTVRPEQIAVGPDHNIWWTELSTNRIGRITPGIGLTSLVYFPTGVTAVVGIAAGGDGNMWYSNGGQLIGRMTTSGTQLGTIKAGTAGSQIGRLIADTNGNIFYEDSGSTTYRFGYVDKTTLTPTNFGSTTTHPLLESTGLALGLDNAIYFLEPVFSGGLSNVGRVTTPANGVAGTYTEFPIPNTTSSTFPFDIATGADGKLWISVFGSTATNQFYASMTTTGTITEYPNVINPAAFANLVTMTDGPDGNLWIAEGGGAVRITPTVPATPVTQFFTDNSQNTMVSCIAGPDANMWCTAIGSGTNPPFNPTNDSIITWKPR